MAIYSLRVQTIARSHGRSVVAAAAYRSGARLVDQRLDMEFDFSRKEGGVAHALILAPDSAPREFFIVNGFGTRRRRRTGARIPSPPRKSSSHSLMNLMRCNAANWSKPSPVKASWRVG